MSFDELTKGISPHDLFLLGVLAGQWIAARGRRFMGERLGRLEEIIAATHPDLTVRRDPATLSPPPPK